MLHSHGILHAAELYITPTRASITHLPVAGKNVLLLRKFLRLMGLGFMQP